MSAVYVEIGVPAIRGLVMGLELLDQKLREFDLNAPAELRAVDRLLREAHETGSRCTVATVSQPADALRSVSNVETMPITEAAVALGRSRRTLERQIRAGEVRSTKRRGRRVLPVDEIDRLMKAKT